MTTGLNTGGHTMATVWSRPGTSTEHTGVGNRGSIDQRPQRDISPMTEDTDHTGGRADGQAAQ